jgi:hypothetical protein
VAGFPATPWPIWGGRTTPFGFGGDPATPKRPKKKRKEKVRGLGGGRATPNPQIGRIGWSKPPSGLWGWSGHPQKAKKQKMVWVLGVAGPPLKD